MGWVPSSTPTTLLPPPYLKKVSKGDATIFMQGSTGWPISGTLPPFVQPQGMVSGQALCNMAAVRNLGYCCIRGGRGEGDIAALVYECSMVWWCGCVWVCCFVWARVMLFRLSYPPCGSVPPEPYLVLVRLG